MCLLPLVPAVVSAQFTDTWATERLMDRVRDDLVRVAGQNGYRLRGADARDSWDAISFSSPWTNYLIPTNTFGVIVYTSVGVAVKSFMTGSIRSAAPIVCFLGGAVFAAEPSALYGTVVGAVREPSCGTRSGECWQRELASVGVTSTVGSIVGSLPGVICGPAVNRSGSLGRRVFTGVRGGALGGAVTGSASAVGTISLDDSMNSMNYIFLAGHYRIKVGYTLLPDEEGSCLLFASIGEDGTVAYEIDSCSNDDAFPQDEEGFMRIGDEAGIFDRYLFDQHDAVVAGRFRL